MQTIGGTKMDPADPNISPSAWNDVGSIRSGSNSTRYRHISQGPPPPPKKSWKKQFADGFRATVAFVFSKVGICVLVVGYLFVGAAMFQQLEGRVFQKCLSWNDENALGWWRSVQYTHSAL